MSELKGIRWRQRFENLRRAYTLFNEGAKADGLNRLEKEGVIQRFEYTFELSWKTIKDYLESQGVVVSYPREVIKEAFAHGLVGDGELWMEMLEKRNLISHTYDEKTFETAFNLACGSFYEGISALMAKLEKEA
jgi:nucleotidyltransferase substrate binding protein (TIGR01987 family)